MKQALLQKTFLQFVYSTEYHFASICTHCIYNKNSSNNNNSANLAIYNWDPLVSNLVLYHSYLLLVLPRLARTKKTIWAMNILWSNHCLILLVSHLSVTSYWMPVLRINGSFGGLWSVMATFLAYLTATLISRAELLAIMFINICRNAMEKYLGIILLRLQTCLVYLLKQIEANVYKLCITLQRKLNCENTVFVLSFFARFANTLCIHNWIFLFRAVIRAFINTFFSYYICKCNEFGWIIIWCLLRGRKQHTP